MSVRAYLLTLGIKNQIYFSLRKERTAEWQAPSQWHWIRSCILARSPALRTLRKVWAVHLQVKSFAVLYCIGLWGSFRWHQNHRHRNEVSLFTHQCRVLEMTKIRVERHPEWHGASPACMSWYTRLGLFWSRDKEEGKVRERSSGESEEPPSLLTLSRRGPAPFLPASKHARLC